MEERLQKIIAAAGIASRRHAEELISAGRVTVNGTVAELGRKADPSVDQIMVDDSPVVPENQLYYLLLHKPRGYVTTMSDEHGRRTATELVADFGHRVYPVGRLDMDSEGLLLFTNDGALTQSLLHPSHRVEKEYHVRVRGDIQKGLPVLRQIKELDGAEISPASVQLLRKTADGGVLSVVIHQGLNRQVRRMCEKADLQVLRLKRVREGSLTLGNLPVGGWRRLTKDEITELKNL